MAERLPELSDLPELKCGDDFDPEDFARLLLSKRAREAVETSENEWSAVAYFIWEITECDNTNGQLDRKVNKALGTVLSAPHPDPTRVEALSKAKDAVTRALQYESDPTRGNPLRR